MMINNCEVIGSTHQGLMFRGPGQYGSTVGLNTHLINQTLHDRNSFLDLEYESTTQKMRRAINESVWENNKKEIKRINLEYKRIDNLIKNIWHNNDDENIKKPSNLMKEMCPWLYE